MRKSVKFVGLVLAMVALSIGTGALVLAPPAAAANGSCWQVDCNTCCKVNGRTICTQRACL